MKKFIFLILLTIFSFHLGTKAAVAQTPTGFVERSGDKLILNGQPYKFIGFNKAGAANDNRYYTCGDGGADPDAFLSEMFSSFKNICSVPGTDFVLRVWFTQAFATRSGSSTLDWTRIDKVISYAKQNNIRLLVTLENTWGDCTKPLTNSSTGRKLNDWYRDGYKLWNSSSNPNNGYTYPLTFREYVRTIVTRYKDEPTIMMWQLMNEAESEDSQGNTDPVSLYGFTKDIAMLIKSIDQNHLVNLGTMGGGQPGTQGGNYTWLHAIPEIDVAETHEYVSATDPYPPHVAKNTNVANYLGKPIFMGEAGIYGNASADPPDIYTFTERKNLFNAKMDAYFNHGGDGYLIWNWTNTRSAPGSSSFTYYQVDKNDPTCTQLFHNYNPEKCEADNTCNVKDSVKTVKYDWESSSEASGWSGGTSTPAISTIYKKTGNSSLMATVNLTGSDGWGEASIVKTLSPAQNWSTDGEKLKVYVYIPPAADNSVSGDFMGKIILYNSSNTSFAPEYVNMAPGIWNELAYENLQLSSISKIELKVANDRIDYNGPVYFDQLHLSVADTNSGDANSDGRVDGIDFITWLVNFSRSVSNGPLSGDFNNDGTVNSADFVLWVSNLF